MKTPLAKTSRGILAGRAGRWIFSGLLFLSMVMLVLGRVNHPVVEHMRANVIDVTSPFLAVLSRPIDQIDAAMDWFGTVLTMVSENSRLKVENERLRQWQSAALALERENERLRIQLNAPVLMSKRVATPRVIGVAGGPFVKSVMVNAGTRQDVMRDFPVVDERGLVGRVFEAGAYSARVLLITDLNSRVPVRIQRTGDPAIARGRNETLLEMSFLPHDADPQIGDAIVTSGDGGIFSPDILVGHIISIETGDIRIRPVSLLDRLEFVQVLMPLSRVLQEGLASDENTVPATLEQAEP